MNSITDLLQKENERYDSQTVPGFVQGTVVENNNPDFKGMVKVEFTVWETGKNMCEWVRLLSPYTGKEGAPYGAPSPFLFPSDACPAQTRQTSSWRTRATKKHSLSECFFMRHRGFEPRTT